MPKEIPFGYWFGDDARWGDYAEELGFTTLWVTSLYTTSDEVYGAGEFRPWAPVQAAAIRHAAVAGKKLLLNLYMGNSRRVPTPKTVNQAALYWDKVIGLDLADEPRKWTRAECFENLAGVRRTIATPRVLEKDTPNERTVVLVPRPLGVTLEHKEQVYTGQVKWFVDAGIDFFGIEAYVDFPGPTDPAKAIAALRERVYKQLDQIPAHVNIVLVLQSYARNGDWDRPPGTRAEDHYRATTGLASLEAIQRESFKIAYELGSRCIAMSAFSYARDSGVLDNPSLKRIHKEQVALHKEL